MKHKRAATEVRQDVLLALGDPLPSGGKTAGFIKVPYSSNTSAYGFIPVPFVVAGPATGPKALLMAGTYGDEAECQIALAQVARELDPAQLQGQVIILPMTNEPAARAGMRNSPIDNVSLGRSYPGDVFGSPTEVIAQYVERFLMPQCDVVVDVHSAGDSLNYLPCVMSIAHADRTEMNQRLALAFAFGAPLVLISHSFEERNSSGAAKRAGTVRIGTEISGDATISMTLEGVANVLRWAGILKTDEEDKTPEAHGCEVLEVHPENDYVYALSSGMFASAVRLGAVVKTGDCAGYIHDTSRPLAEPDEVHFMSAGKVVCVRPSGHAQRGDCLMHLATDPDRQTAEQITSIERAFWGANQSHSRGKQTPRR